ncbi:methyltransferase, partial [bacterium]|nr:methyltransferase [bacterium]
LRALQTLREAEVIIGEETKPLFQLLKHHNIPRPAMAEFLNEHSKDVDIDFFVGLCRDKKVALVTDCGTPGFCDPGAVLVKRCRTEGIAVSAVPGASSLMVLLSLCGLDLKEFYFRGFLPANNEKRREELQRLKKIKVPLVLMDTPYRFRALLEDLRLSHGDSRCVIGVNLTQDSEQIVDSLVSKLDLAKLPEKAEFILVVY